MIFDLEKKATNAIALKDDQNHVLTYGALVSKIEDSSSLLPERSLVFVLSDNTTQVVSFLTACLENKWVPLLLNKDLDLELFENYISTFKPNAIFHSSTTIESNYSIKRNHEWGDYKIAVLDESKYQIFNKLSFLLPTSGSTGSPKLVRHSYENLSFSAKSVSEFFKLSTNDIGLAALPAYYTMGFSVITSHLQSGAQVRLTNYSLTEKGFWEILKNEDITTITGVPYTFDVLFRMRFERVKMTALRIITQGGGKLYNNLWESLVQYAQKNEIEFIPTYGQTEGTARMSYLASKYTQDKKGSIGKPIPNGNFEIWDENGQLLKEIEAEGELIYRGNNVTLGYAEKLSDLEKGDERGGVLQTGDIVKRDSDGFYYIIGRKKRFLKIFSLRISLDEIEVMLRNTFGIDCYASGTDSLLQIYITEENRENEIKYWLSKKIDLFHQTIEIKYLKEIPRNASGKVIFEN